MQKYVAVVLPGMEQATPPSNSFNPIFFLPFIIVPVLIAVVFVCILRVIKHADHDGDGLSGDAKPATPEQKKLIQEGFRRLGVHHEVKKKLTQAEARETLREIDQKLKRK
jgi:hypothetical protein